MEDTMRKRRSYQRRWVKAKHLKLKQGTFSTSDNTDSHEEESSFADSMEDDWKVAKQWLSKSEYTSNLDTSSSETENSRIRRRPKRLYESSDNEITEDLSSSAAPATKKIATEWDNQSVNVSTNDVANNPGPGQVELVDNESASSTMLEKNEVSFSGSSTSAASGTIVEGNLEYDVRDAVGQMQDAIGQMQDGIGQMQATLSSLEPIIMEISHSVKGRRNSKKPSDLIVQDIIPVTMTTNEDLKAFDKKLQQNKEFASDAIIGFSSVGGDNIGQTVRFILKKVASAGVWSCYSRVGKNAKEAFSNLALDKIIYRACKKIHGRSFPEKDYIRVVGEALRHFPSQKGGSRWKGVEKKRPHAGYLTGSSEDET